MRAQVLEDDREQLERWAGDYLHLVETDLRRFEMGGAADVVISQRGLDALVRLLTRVYGLGVASVRGRP